MLALDGFSSGPSEADASPVETDTSSVIDGSSEEADALEKQRGDLKGSCKDIKVASPNAVSGLFLIDGDNVLPELEVYCEMAHDGGGWTLVARSVYGIKENFGWFVAHGDVRNDDVPFSLDISHVKFDFKEILVATRSTEKKRSAVRPTESRFRKIKFSNTLAPPSS